MSKLQSDEKLSEIAALLKQKMDNHEKSLKELATSIGYEKSNVLSMMKNGDIRVPLDKVVTIARVLDIDPNYLMKLALKQIFPESSDAWIIFDGIISNNEANIISRIRDTYDGVVPSLNDTQITQIVNYIKKICPPIKPK